MMILDPDGQCVKIGIFSYSALPGDFHLLSLGNIFRHQIFMRKESSIQ